MKNFFSTHYSKDDDNHNSFGDEEEQTQHLPSSFMQNEIHILPSASPPCPSTSTDALDKRTFKRNESIASTTPTEMTEDDENDDENSPSSTTGQQEQQKVFDYDYFLNGGNTCGKQQQRRQDNNSTSSTKKWKRCIAIGTIVIILLVGVVFGAVLFTSKKGNSDNNNKNVESSSNLRPSTTITTATTTTELTTTEGSTSTPSSETTATTESIEPTSTVATPPTATTIDGEQVVLSSTNEESSQHQQQHQYEQHQNVQQQHGKFVEGHVQEDHEEQEEHQTPFQIPSSEQFSGNQEEPTEVIDTTTTSTEAPKANDQQNPEQFSEQSPDTGRQQIHQNNKWSTNSFSWGTPSKESEPSPSPTPSPITLSPTPSPITPSPTPSPITPSPTPSPITPSPTPSPITPPPTPPATSAWEDLFTEAHNTRRRAFHQENNVEPVDLQWSSGIAVKAQTYADTLVEQLQGCSIRHGVNDDYYGGENLASHTMMARGMDINQGLSQAEARSLIEPNDILNMWYDNEYNLSFSEDKYHLSQIVWRSTKYFGCGVATKPMGEQHVCVIHVCRYIRPGNCNLAQDGSDAVQKMLGLDSPCRPFCPPEGC